MPEDVAFDGNRRYPKAGADLMQNPFPFVNPPKKKKKFRKKKAKTPLPVDI